MHFQALLVGFCAFVAAIAIASPVPRDSPFEDMLSKRQSAPMNSSLMVDLGYEMYNGVHNSTSGLNTWLGIRYAAPPTGQMRFQKPQPPKSNRNMVIQANALPPRCPQSSFLPYYVSGTNITGNEDCLFLSVYAPPNATNLPVFVWIHGGGYGLGQGDQDPTMLMAANNNSFVSVIIQYRLGAFGFLSSDEVYRYGTPNAGIHDQYFALEWTQSYIHLFGGNSSQVTVAGESAGAGSVMLQAMAFGGQDGTRLFSNAIAASPYLPTQWGYADFVPSQSYYAFANAAGCFHGVNWGGFNNSIFECLLNKDTMTLQMASNNVSIEGKFGTWGFLPVTDGEFIQNLPSVQLQQGKVNGLRMLAGNNANEGPLFTPQNITTEDDFLAFLNTTFPLFDNDDLAKVLMYYPSSNASDTPSMPRFSTTGTSGPSALNESEFGTGQQQRADNLYGESTFSCPAYWLAEAYTKPGYEAYRYQYSAPPAQHGSDVQAYFGPPSPLYSPDLMNAFMQIWGNFITHNNPSIPNAVANNATSSTASNSTSSSSANNTFNPASQWPMYSLAQPYMINLNVTLSTGGMAANMTSISAVPGAPNVSVLTGPNVVNDFSLVNAYTWEAGRGIRCDFWRSIGSLVPE
ncbi:alpha/beta-hydrolase [Xylona heveae TC161]|uniref:Carboxylic ester hydrolase n=1 Tax=Xylona heveae (strain CBS 132557 / TC161) TaxID=1328760 RepID=A0A165F9W1_XYLHT|nr:alpha/beta-hydrolase [Xylona heveae TC161]KZF20748.1 alpha/beta-hydrolase [Xylona heveae TC161]